MEQIVKVKMQLKEKKTKLWATFLGMYAAAYTCIENAYADPSMSGIFGTAQNAINTIQTGMIGISTALAGLCAVVGLVAILISGERGAAKWIGFLKRVAIAYGCIWAINGILALIKSVATS